VVAAAALAKRRNERLYLVHVASSGGLFGGRASPSDSQSALEAEVDRLRSEGLSVTADILTGKFDVALSRYCVEREAGLLVVGDTEKPAPTIMASSLDRFALVVDVPLVVVRDEGPFVRWGPDSPLKVMLAFDRTAASAVARDWLVRLAEFGPVHLVATQIYVPEDEYHERGMKLPGAGEGHAALARLLQQELARQFDGLPPTVTLSLHAEQSAGNVSEQLLKAASAEKADLVLVGNHRRRALDRLRSVSHKLLLHSPMSVACVPSTTPVPDIGHCPSWERVLVASDLTESGSRAIAWAASLLKPGHILHVVHVTESPVTPEGEAALKKRLTQSLPLSCEGNGGDVVLHVLQGEPREVLRVTADRLEVDVLVIGSLDVPEFEEADEFVIAPKVMEQWRLVQTLLETTHLPVLVTPPLRA
jgi:nucleotide-binding universal stress UspA family protein